MCIKNKQNSLNPTALFLLWYFHLHVLAGNPAVFRVTFLLQEYRDADKSLARPTSRCILFDGENISFDASLVLCIYK